MRMLWMVLALLAAAPAYAQVAGGLEEARAHLKRGTAAYDEGRYEDAAHEMEAAYAIKQVPDLQYNMAQCYERLGRHADAAAAYRRYLAGKPGADDREIVRLRITNLDERVRQGAAAPPSPPAVEVLKEVIVYREAPAPPGRGARFAGYASGALAVGGLAAGIVFTVLSQRNSDQVSQGGSLDHPVVYGGRIADADSSGRTHAIVSYVSFGVAGAAALGAVGLFLLGNKIDREAQEAPKVTLSPLAGGGALSVMGAF